MRKPLAIYLIRHADAVSPHQWQGEGGLRPLTKLGRRQAQGLIDQIADVHLKRVLSSPAVRCMQTVEPLALAHRVDVEETDDLAEGAGAQPTFILMELLSGIDAALCTHGDVIEDVIGRLVEMGVLEAREVKPTEK